MIFIVILQSAEARKTLEIIFWVKRNCALMLSADDADKPAENIPGASHSFD